MRGERSRDARKELGQALEAETAAETLASLLFAWNVGFAPEIADVLVRVPAPPDLAAALGGKGRTAREAWLARAKVDDARDMDAALAAVQALPALLATLLDAGPAYACPRLAALRRWPMPDPRIDRALAALLREPPLTSRASLPFWTAVFDAAREIRDRRAYQVLCAADLDRHVGKPTRAVFASGLPGLREALAPRFAAAAPALTGFEHGQLAAIAAKLDGRPPAYAAREDELLRAVFDNPEDDDARMVYADALLERGDPRGEIISLQLARHRRGTPATQRELELLQRHAKQHMGPLWRVMLPNAAEFERGFLSSGFIYRSGSEVFDAEVCGSPWWSTMHHLEGAEPELLGHPALRRLTSAVISGVETVCAVADRGPAALRALTCHFRLEYYTRVGWDDALEALADPPGLPALTELALVFPDEPSSFHPSPTDYAALLDGPVMSRLSRLRLCAHDHDWRYPDPPLTLRGWLTTLAQLRVPRLELDQQRNRYTFERAADRYQLCELHCAWADERRAASVASVAGALASLEPGDVAAELRLRLDGKHAWTAAAMAPIHRALKRFTHVRPTFVPDEA